MRDYELVFILDSDLTSQKREKLTAKIKKLIVETKGKVGKTKDWGQQELAYPIRKKLRGNYFYWEVTMPESGPTEFEKKIKFEEEVVRYLLVKKEIIKSLKKSKGKAKKGGETV